MWDPEPRASEASRGVEGYFFSDEKRVIGQRKTPPILHRRGLKAKQEKMLFLDL